MRVWTEPRRALHENWPASDRDLGVDRIVVGARAGFGDIQHTKIIASIEDPQVIGRILKHLGGETRSPSQELELILSFHASVLVTTDGCSRVVTAQSLEEKLIVQFNTSIAGRAVAGAALIAIIASGVAGAEDRAVTMHPVTRNIAQEERNRALVIDFTETVFNRHDLSIASTVIAQNYIQHNPRVPNGSAAFINFFTDLYKQHPTAHSTIERTATDGDLVYVHTHSTSDPQDRGLAIINIYRVVNGKITEHWDVIQPVPEQSANDNTMF
jgi:predicted SnoaL-like aldol condensation-catalyzing enzyme